MIAARTGRLWAAPGGPPCLQRISEPHQLAIAATKETNVPLRAADFSLRIAPMIVELSPQVALSTIGYSNQVPVHSCGCRRGNRSA
jgi:hypothetical protein